MGQAPYKKNHAKKKSIQPQNSPSSRPSQSAEPFPSTPIEKKELAEDSRRLRQAAAQLAKAISKDENLGVRLRKYLADVKRYVRALERASKRYSSRKRPK